MEEKNNSRIINHYEAGANCQVFNGPISGCVFAMPGSTVNQSPVQNTNLQEGCQEKKQASKAEQLSNVSDTDNPLLNEAAMKYWALLNKHGFTSADHHLMSTTTRKQAMYIAETFAEKLDMKSKWKPFEKLWGIKNLAQEKYDMQEKGSLPLRYDEIDSIFAS